MSLEIITVNDFDFLLVLLIMTLSINILGLRFQHLKIHKTLKFI